jgi:drug/metabolite transporter (DMT)-like permease
MFSKRNKALLQIHFAVILFGFTAILGDLINLSALMIVWWRVLITGISLLFFIKWGRELLKLSKKEILIFLGIGMIIALHWLSFYGAVKLSNASITLICMATTSLFTSIIEPVYFKRRLNWMDILLGVLIIPCMVLVVNGVSESYYLGVIVGLFSAFTASLFSVINKKYVDNVNIMSMTFVEMMGVFIFLSILMPFVFGYSEQAYSFLPPTGLDWFYIGILSILCTTVAWVISLIALRVLTVFEANLVVNLEPVYGMALAAVILKEHEQLNTTFYIGAAMILVIVLMYPYLKKRQSKVISNG